MTIYAEVDTVPSQCGGKIIHSFSNYPEDGFYTLRTLAQIKKIYRGLMLIATFNQLQREEYEACCKTFTWLGQSKPIRNPSTGNYIFTAVFKA